MGRSRRRKRRWFAIAGLALLLLVASAYAYVRIEWEGEDLGDNIARILNKRMRGRIEIGAVEWDPSALKKVITGGWVSVRIRNVKVWDDCALSSDLAPLDERRRGDPAEDCTPDNKPDPDPSSRRKPRKLLIDAPLVTAEIDVHAAAFGNHDLTFRNVHVWGGTALLEQAREPYPLHAYDRTIISIVTAFYPRLKAGFRAGIYAAETPPKFDLRDIHVHDLNAIVQFGPKQNVDGSVGYLFAALVTGVNVDAAPLPGMLPTSYLHVNADDPLVPKLYVRLGVQSKHASVRILDEGPRDAFGIPTSLGTDWAKGRKAEYQIELNELVINRLAQLPDQWAKKDYVANNLELDISAHTVPCTATRNPAEGADLHLTGQLLEWWDRPYDGKWDLKLAVKNLGPTLRTCIKSTMGGDKLDGTVRLSGPFIADPKVTLDLVGLDYDVSLKSDQEPLQLTLAEVHGEIDLVNEQGSIDRTTALVRGGKEPGEVMVGATFQLRPWRVKSSIDIIKPIDVARFLPPKAVGPVGKFLQGKLTAEGDSELGFELKDFDLSLGRTEKEKSIRVYKGRLFTDNNFKLIRFQKISIEAGRSRATFDGWIDTVKEDVDLSVTGCFPDLGVWLRRFNLKVFAESACGSGAPDPGVAFINAAPGGGSGGNSTVKIKGNYKNPSVQVQTTLAGVPCLDKLALNVTVANDIATIHKITSSGFGGSLSGSGQMTMPAGGGTPRIDHLHIEGRRLEAAKVCGLKGLIKGTIDTIDVEVRSTTIVQNRDPADWLASFVIRAQAKKLNVLGENYSNVIACVNRSDDHRCRPNWAEKRLAPTAKDSCEAAKKNGGFCAVAAADRDVGGRFAATVADVPPLKSGKAKLARRLGGTIALDDIPLAALDPFIGTGNVGGLVSATLNLAGDRTAPSVEIGSTVNLTRAWVAGAYIGDMQLGVIPTTYGKVHAIRVYGSAMAGQLGIDAILGTAKPFPVDAVFSGRRVEVDHFVNLTKKLGLSEPVQAWASGAITFRTELSPLNGNQAQPEAWIELREVEAILNHKTRDGRRMPIHFQMVPRDKSGNALSLRVTPSTLEFSCRNFTVVGGRQPCPARLVTPAGVVEISGGATQSQMAISAIGQSLELSKLKGLLENQFDDITGTLELNAKVGGTFAKPTYEVSLDVKDRVTLRLPGGDSVLQVLGPRVVEDPALPLIEVNGKRVHGEQVPGGRIKVANGTLAFENSFTINVRDERKDEQGELAVLGIIGLNGLTPANWGVQIQGKIAGKMLSAIAPSKIAQASGLATIDASLGGKGKLPFINATLQFTPEPGKQRTQPLTILPRGVKYEIAMLEGAVQIKTNEAGTHRTYVVDFSDEPLTASINGEGTVSNIRGNVVLTDGTLERADIALDADNIPYRKSGLYDFIISTKNVNLVLPGPSSVWQATGSVSIVNGSYRRDFELAEALKPAPELVAPAKPWWDEYPTIGNADLDLVVEVRKFSVENNIANIDLAGPRLIVSGSPRDPRISGSIRVQRGEFKLPVTRAKFTQTYGSIDFAENERAGNPSLDITSKAPDYTDQSGQQHTITVLISGSLEQPLWDLSTSTGYNKSQTLALLLLGRNPEQFRRTFGGQIGSNPLNPEVSTNPGGSAGDQIIRDLAGDWVSGLVSGSLKDIIGLDVLRFEIGFGSIGVHGEKKLIENVRVLGDGEQTGRGSSLNARLEAKMPLHFLLRAKDNLSLQGTWLKKNFNDPAEQDTDDLGARVVYRLFIP